MGQSTILAIEDHQDIRELLNYNLTKAGHKVLMAEDGQQGLRMIRNFQPDLVLLDLMLPGISGLDVCRSLKNDPQLASVPVVMVTANGTEDDIVKGLELGADDYITKPFVPKVLLARVNAVLRRHKKRPSANAKETVEVHELSIHPGKREALLQGQVLKLTYSEFAILHLLALKPGWVFTRKQIVNGIRGDGYAVTERSIDVQIVGLRKKLGECGNYIETIRGVGYRFLDQ